MKKVYLFFVLVLSILSAANATDFYAVLVGVKISGSEISCPHEYYCVRDALKAFPHWGDYWESRVVRLEGEQAVKSDIEVKIQQMLASAGPGDVCLFFFMGDGHVNTIYVLNNQGNLITVGVL